MSHQSLIRHSWRSELRVLAAIAHKEWTLFRRYPSWMAAFVIWPVLFPLGYVFVGRTLGGPNGADTATFQQLTGTSDYLSYIVIGSTLYMWLNMTLWDVGFQLRAEQMRGTLESNWLCPIPRISILLGSTITKLGTALIFLLITVVEFWVVFGVRLWQGDVRLLLLLLLLAIASIYGIAMAFASLVLRFKEANAMVFMVRGLFLVFCGITYPIAVMPGWMRTISAVLPLTYAIHAIRAVTLSQATFTQIWPDIQWLLVFAVVLPILGYVAFAVTERRARRSGTLGQY